MASDQTPFLIALDRRIADMTSACTRCGACVEACPMPARTDVDDAQPERLISAVVARLTDGAPNAEAQQWAGVCCGSGYCIKACPHELNPRFLLAMVRRAQAKDRSLQDRRTGGRAAFKKMSRGVRVLSRLQMPPEVLNRLSPSSHPDTESSPDLVFYTGCNLLKTPHIGLLCLDVLDLLGFRYEVHGGPSNCCGIYQTRSGDEENAVRQSMRTIDQLTRSGPGEVLSWCPTCQIQFGETMFPIRIATTMDDVPPGPTGMTMFPVFLHRNLELLRPHLKYPVPRRVALHEHPGSEGVTEAVVAVLCAIPELEVVTLPVPRIGYSLGSLRPIPEQRNALIAQELAAAEAAGIDVLAGIYHSDHREIVSHHPYWPFDVVNYMELIGQSIGISHADTFKRLKAMRDVDAVMCECMPLMEEYGLDTNEVREVIETEMFGEQMLPVDRARHAAVLASPTIDQQIS